MTNPSACPSSSVALAMVRLRCWQHVLNEALKKNTFRIPVHLAFGHEAIAVAVAHTMQDDDELVLTHRNVAYNLARANALEPVYQEFQLAASGLGGGRLGSMNLVNPSRGIVYSSSILGNNIPVACGLALARQVRGAGTVTVLTGDGAMEEGTFYEGLVFARSHTLPLVIVVENNDQAMSSTIQERRCPIAIGAMCASVGVSFVELAGNDVTAYMTALQKARETASRAGASTPVCIEVALTAFNQHAGPTPGWATDPKKIDMQNGLALEASARDPLHVLEQQLGGAMFARLTEQVLAENAEWLGCPTTSQP